MQITASELKAIARLHAYMVEGEKKHYEESNKPKGHIFEAVNALRRVANYGATLATAPATAPRVFQVEVKETLVLVVEEEAESAKEAVESVQEQYGNADIVLDSSDFLRVDINAV